MFAVLIFCCMQALAYQAPLILLTQLTFYVVMLPGDCTESNGPLHYIGECSVTWVNVCNTDIFYESSSYTKNCAGETLKLVLCIFFENWLLEKQNIPYLPKEKNPTSSMLLTKFELWLYYRKGTKPAYNYTDMRSIAS